METEGGTWPSRHSATGSHAPELMPLPEREEEPAGSGDARPADAARPNNPPTDDDLRAALPRGWLQAIRGEADVPDPPARLRNRYDRREQLGRGGMGGVWRYFDTHTRRDVAIKFAYEGREDALREEVEILAQLDHPSIPRALDAGDDRGLAFAVFPLIEGPTLHAMLVARRPSPASLYEDVGATHPSDRPSPGGATPSTKSAWPVRPEDRITQPATADAEAEPAPPSKAEAARLLSAFRDLTTALGAMHHRGLLHIDIKPANIMLGPDGRGYLIDFGLASGSDGGHGDEDGGAHGGTPQYMSPEQASGVGGLDFRSDIYSLGVSLHEGLTGVRVVRPPDGLGTRARADWIKATVTTTPVPKLSAAAPGLNAVLGKDTTAALEAVLDKACRKNPAERYATAEAFDADLARAAAGRAPHQAVANRFVVRRRLRLATAAVLAISASAFAVSSWNDARAHRKTVDSAAAEIRAAEATLETTGERLPVWEAIGERRRIIESDDVLAADQRRFVKDSSIAFAQEAVLGQCLTIFDAGRRLKQDFLAVRPRHQRYAAAAESLRGFLGDDVTVDIVAAFGAYVDCRFDDVDRILERCEHATGESAQLRSTLIVCAGFSRMRDGAPGRLEEIGRHMERLGVTAKAFDPDALTGLPLACAAFVYIAGLKEPGVAKEARVVALENRLSVRSKQLAVIQAEDRRRPAAHRTNSERAEVLRVLAARLAFARGAYATTIEHLDALDAPELSPDNVAAMRILRGAAALKLAFDPRMSSESRAVARGRWASDLAAGLSAAPAAISSLVDLLSAAPERFGAPFDADAASKASSEACLAALEIILHDPQFRWSGDLSRAEASSPELARLAIAAILSIVHDETAKWARVTSCLFAYIAGTGPSSMKESGLDLLLTGQWIYGVVDDALKSADCATALRAAEAAHEARVGAPALNDAALGRAHAHAAEAPGASPGERQHHRNKARAHLLAALATDTGLPGIVAAVEARARSLSTADPRQETLSHLQAQLEHIIENAVKPELAKIPPDGP